MHTNNFLYNINGVLVQPGYEKDYIEFSAQLNHYLLNRYGTYYMGLDLSKDKIIGNQFTVVAFYHNVRGVEEAQKEIQADITRIYESYWGDKVKRIATFSFLGAKKVIPIHANLYEW